MLDCLRNAYKTAVEFDSRPGLKFLIQKVARTEVAVNLYKQAGASIVFYIHSLLQICANIPDLTTVKVKQLSCSVQQNLLNNCYLNAKHNSSIAKVLASPDLFIQLLKAICDELCQSYVDILSDETSSCVDSMAEQQVFFLIAQPDDITDIVGKRKKSQTEDPKPKPSGHSQDLMSAAVPLQGEIYKSLVSKLSFCLHFQKFMIVFLYSCNKHHDTFPNLSHSLWFSCQKTKNWMVNN